MPSWIQGRGHSRDAFFMCLVACLAAACTMQPPRDRTAIPEAFTDPVRFPDFSSTVKRASIEGRIRRSKCGLFNADRASIAITGIDSRPETSGAIVLDTGSTPDGTSWYIHRSAD